jgi:hypothetical protein
MQRSQRNRSPHRRRRGLKRTSHLPSPERHCDHTRRFAAALKQIEGGLKKAATEFQRRSTRARRAGRSVEAAICARLASRLRSLEEFSKNEVEIIELVRWLPVPASHRRKTLLERKAWQVRFIRGQSLGHENESLLIASATKRRGRPPGARECAARAFDLHERSWTWRRIEQHLLPHLRNATKPGEVIRREVQLLKATLNRHDVTV